MAFKDRLAKQQAAGTARHTIHSIDLGDGPPVLELRHAGESNRGYWSAALKLANEPGRVGDGKLSPESVARGRKVDADLFARFVVVGWEHVLEEDGTPTPCTPDRVRELLEAIIEHTPDAWIEIFMFARDRRNFVAAPAADGIELGKS